MDDSSFFGKNGTMKQAMGVANSISDMKTMSAMTRAGALAHIVSTIMSFFV